MVNARFSGGLICPKCIREKCMPLLMFIIFDILQYFDQILISGLSLPISLQIIGGRSKMFHTKFTKKLSELGRNECCPII
jgi:hypothetical protein